MPKLKDQLRETKIIELPNYPGSKVEIYDSVMVGDLTQVNFAGKTGLDLTAETLPKFIKSWNFTNENDEPLEVNRDNINFMKAEDAAFLAAEISKFNSENKKKLETLPDSQ